VDTPFSESLLRASLRWERQFKVPKGVTSPSALQAHGTSSFTTSVPAAERLRHIFIIHGENHSWPSAFDGPVGRWVFWRGLWRHSGRIRRAVGTMI